MYSSSGNLLTGTLRTRIDFRNRWTPGSEGYKKATSNDRSELGRRQIFFMSSTLLRDLRINRVTVCSLSLESKWIGTREYLRWSARRMVQIDLTNGIGYSQRRLVRSGSGLLMCIIHARIFTNCGFELVCPCDIFSPNICVKSRAQWLQRLVCLPTSHTVSIW
jgi:hypothetical protein